MKVGDAISSARKRAGLTQEQLAAKVYVTRQAVSRWENGDSEPSVDMRKLLAVVLEIPAAELFDLPDAPACQCCGTPFDVPNMPFGTDADGTENPDYCGWCYQNGKFTSAGLDEIIERNVPFLMEATGYTAEEAVSFMGAVLPTLKRWRTAENRNLAADCRKGVFYACPDCGNAVWSMGEATVNCCGNVLEPLAPRRNDGILAAQVEVADGCQRVSIDHPMTKRGHLTYIIAVGDDLVRIKRLYPEQGARAEFPPSGTLHALRVRGGLRARRAITALRFDANPNSFAKLNPLREHDHIWREDTMPSRHLFMLPPANIVHGRLAQADVCAYSFPSSALRSASRTS